VNGYLFFKAAEAEEIPICRTPGDFGFRSPHSDAEVPSPRQAHWIKVHELLPILLRRHWAQWTETSQYCDFMELYEEAKRLVAVEDEAALWRAAYGKIQLENERNA
jgi:hypothetical protein